MLASVGTFVIENGESESTAEIDLRGVEVKALQMPASWTASSIAFFCHPWPSTDSAHANENNAAQLALVLQVSAGQYRLLNADEAEMVEGLAITSIQSIDEGDLPTITAVNQGAERRVTIMGCAD